jgi:hypothetical protein
MERRRLARARKRREYMGRSYLSVLDRWDRTAGTDKTAQGFVEGWEFGATGAKIRQDWLATDERG